MIMKMTTTFAAIAMCAGLYLTTGPAQALVSMNGLYPNGLHLNALTMNGLHLNALYPNGLYPNGLSNNRVTINGIYLNGTALKDQPIPEVQRESLPFNGLSQKSLGKTHP
jgi:hypothetical protein